ncbi:MAG: ATP-binding protein [Clostridia bacterium]
MARRTMKSNPRPVLNYGNKETCPVCGGSGWEMYSAPAEIYNGRMTPFMKQCSKCGGKNDGDFSGIPFAECDITRFNFGAYSVKLDNIKKIAMFLVDNFEKWQNTGKGIYLWSKTPGSGKTFLASCIARSLMLKYGLQVKFVTVPDYINHISNSYKRQTGQLDESAVFRDCKLLILDDIGAQIGRDWQGQEIFRLVNQRLLDNNITFYTSNMPPEKLNLEPRTIDRVIKSCVTIQLPEESIRLQKARDEQEKFLQDIIG